MKTGISNYAHQIDSQTKSYKLLPIGEFEAHYVNHKLTEPAAEAIVASYKKSKKDKKMVVDYEHGTVMAERTGQKNPAAGWVDDLELKDDGLYATISWTQAAIEHIKGREYKYLSPAFFYDKDGAVKAMHSIAFTNNPALPLSEIATFSGNIFKPNDDKKSMKEEKTLKALQNELAEAQKAKTAAEESLKVLEAKRNEDKLEPSYDLKAQLETLQKEFLEVVNQKEAMEAANKKSMIDEAIADGTLNENQAKWAEDQPLATLSGFFKASSKKTQTNPNPLAALSGQQTGAITPPTGAQSKLSEGDESVARSLGLSVDEYSAKYLNK